MPSTSYPDHVERQSSRDRDAHATSSRPHRSRSRSPDASYLGPSSSSSRNRNRSDPTRERDRERERTESRHRHRHCNRDGDDRHRTSPSAFSRRHRQDDREGRHSGYPDRPGSRSRSNRDGHEPHHREGSQRNDALAASSKSDHDRRRADSHSYAGRRSPSPSRARHSTRERDQADRSARQMQHSRSDRTEAAALPPPVSLQASPSAVMQAEQEPEPNAPNFEPSGLLAAESNNKDGVALKYHEPPEARKPPKPWRMYVFKDGKEVDMIPIGAQSAYLLGRDRIVVDIPLDHPSCSKQHAVIQFRRTIHRNEFGDEKRRTRPFLIDLDSANGSLVNETEVPPSRYYEIKSGDSLKFGASTREYVCIDEGAA